MIPFTRLFRPISLLAWLPVIALALASPSVVRAADDEPPELAEKTNDAFSKLQPLLDAKNWDGALNLLNGILPSTDPDSYDRALVLDTIARISIQKDDTEHAVAAWEQALALGDQHHNYFKAKDMLDVVLSLAQSYSQMGQNTKDPVQQREYFTKAGMYIKRWLGSTSNPTLETEYFYAEVLYSQATATPKPDLGLIREAQQQAEKALRLSVHPPEKLYLLLIATYQQLQDFDHAADLFEYLAQENPVKSPSYWPQLWQTYMNLASTADEKNPDKLRIDYIRGINAMERAQTYGQMKSNKDYYNLFTMYYTAGQYGKATDILSAGLHDGTIESTLEHWLYLADCYRLVADNDKAIGALKDAEARFPDSGEIDFQIAQIYWQDEKTAEAYQYFADAVRKGNLHNLFNTYQYMASVAYDLEKFQEAEDAVQKASELPEGRSSTQLGRLKASIDQALQLQKQQEAVKAAAAAAGVGNGNAAPPANP